ncbi:uncharacterized protein LOC133030646 [Cannabis sativa]|uniref:uncharacterized protein LOC133030646 n=1 Tax=Cannabis sativa TaxID=3483 RepID=UPI0029CA6AD0|nr:uncharacterized protein LOC133030646 [Cannabis sativa]
MFNQRDAELIIGIPLSSSSVEDYWSWIGERSGEFSVKSAYNMLQNQKHGRHDANNSGFWHKLCHLKIPPKCRNCLPHIFELHGCWDKAKLFALFDSTTSIGHWLDHLFKNYDEDVYCRAIMVCWAIWKARNTLVWDNKISSPTQVLTSAWTTLDHWRKAQDKNCLLSLSLQH